MIFLMAELLLQVSEEEIVSAMRMLFMHAKVVVEPSGAVGLAAVIKVSAGCQVGGL